MTTAVTLGSDTIAQGGSRFTTPTWSSFAPVGYGPTTTGVPQVSPTMPPFLGGQASPTGAIVEGVGGYGTAGNNAVVATIANQNPHHYQVSPVWWAVLLLVAGLLILRGVHWRKTVLEGAEEHAHIGPARESAAEEV